MLNVDLMSLVCIHVGVSVHDMPIPQVQERPVVRVGFGRADWELSSSELLIEAFVPEIHSSEGAHLRICVNI
jgi:hypothetical protein